MGDQWKEWGCYKERNKGERILLEGRRDWEAGRGRSGKDEDKDGF